MTEGDATLEGAGEGLLGVGATLAREREARGLGLAEVSQQLKFMPRQLEALENERFALLPGPTIARGMVRTYARFLKLDPEPLLERMAGAVQPRDATPQLAARFSQPVPFGDSGRRSTIAYLALSACVLALGAGVLYQWRQESAGPQFIAAASLASDPVAAAPAPAARRPAATQTASAGPIPSLAATPTEARPPQPQPQPDAPKRASVPAPAPAAAAKPAEPPAEAKAVEQRVAEAKTVGSQRIVFRFDEEAWIEVTDGAGRLLASSLNPAGSERVLQGRPPFNLVIGNANHVRLSYNDREVDLQPHVRVEVARFTLQ